MRPSARVLAVAPAVILAFFLAPSSFGQIGQQTTFGQGDAERYELRGRVVNSVTSEGVAHALVQLYASSEKTVFSGDDGGFDFTDVPRGSYTVMVRKPGFFNEQELRRWNPGAFTATVGVPQEGDAVIKLTPEGIVHGKIIGENEEPIEYVNVQLQAWLTQDGRRRLQSVANGTSDDQGNFRVAELLPGKYILRFLPRAGGRPGNPAGPRQAEGEGYGSEFYPGVADAAAAEVIRVKAGGQVRIVQTLGKQRVYQVSGFVRGAQPDSGFGLNLTDSAGEPVQTRTQVDQRTGAFRLQGIPGGSYLLQAMSWSRNGENQQPVNAYIPLRVNGDVSGLTIMLGRGASVGVQLDDERMQRGLPEGMPRVSITMTSEDMPQFGRGMMFPPPKEDKNAPTRLEGLPPGRYRVEASPNGQGYVAELRCGGVDLLRDDVMVPADGALPPIHVTLRNDGGQIAVTPVKMGQSAAAMVVIFSEDYPKRSLGVPFQGGGSIGWGNIPPGVYKVVAVENAADLEFRSPTAMEKYLAHAVEVNLGPEDHKDVRVEVQEAQEAEQ